MQLKSLFCGIALLAGASSAQAALYFSQDNNGGGLYTLNTSTGLATPVGTSGVTSATVGLAEHPTPGRLYGSTYTDLVSIAQNGSGAAGIGLIDRPGGAQDGAEGLAYDAVRNILFGAINGSFYTINQGTGVASANLAAPGADVEGLAWDGADTIYGLAGFSGPRGNLYAYDIPTNVWRLVGNTGIQFNLPGLAYDLSQGILYGIGSQDPNLYRINPANAATASIGNTGLTNTGGGLAFTVDIPEPASALLGIAGMGALALRRRRTA